MHSFGKRDGSEVYGDFEYKNAILHDQQNWLKIIHFIGLSRPIYNADLTRGISFYVWFKIWTNDICDIIICCAKNNTTTTKTEWTWAAWLEKWTAGHVDLSHWKILWVLCLPSQPVPPGTSNCWWHFSILPQGHQICYTTARDAGKERAKERRETAFWEDRKGSIFS